jgi:hypothetical protein
MPVSHTRDSTTNDSDKVVLTAATGFAEEILSVHVVLTSTATVGNRQVIIAIRDENDVLVADFHAGAVQAASLTRHYTCGQGVYRETSFIDGSIHMPMPKDMYLLPGWDLRVYDSGAIDAAADDMTVDVLHRSVNMRADDTGSLLR